MPYFYLGYARAAYATCDNPGGTYHISGPYSHAEAVEHAEKARREKDDDIIITMHECGQLVKRWPGIAHDAERVFYANAEKEFAPVLRERRMVESEVAAYFESAKSLPEALGVLTETVYTPETIEMMEDAAERREQQERDEQDQDEYDDHQRELTREYLRMVGEAF